MALLLCLAALLSLTACSDSSKNTPADPDELYKKQVKTFSHPSPGSYLRFGSYEQDNNPGNGQEEILWRVLAVEEGRVLVVSAKVLDCYVYQDAFEEVTWETCDLREWLNSEFLEKAFGEKHLERIVDAQVVPDENTNYPEVNPGKATVDKLFLLSRSQVLEYFPSQTAAKCEATPYARERGAYHSEDGVCWWWTRTVGNTRCYAVSVDLYGNVRSRGDAVYVTRLGVRPAMWISTDFRVDLTKSSS